MKERVNVNRINNLFAHIFTYLGLYAVQAGKQCQFVFLFISIYNLNFADTHDVVARRAN
jgi:hypothetical protein